MAIQIPNVGTGNAADQSGDNEWLAMKKVADNFSDQTNAASRLVGKASDQIPLAEHIQNLAFSKQVWLVPDTTENINNLDFGMTLVDGSSVGQDYPQILTIRCYNNTVIQLAFPYGALYGAHTLQMRSGDGARTPESWSSWSMFYNNKNTTRDANGFIKAASPIVRVFASKVEFNDDAAAQNIEYIKNGVGDYLIKNSSGLSNDGWYIETPKDANGNVLVAVVYKQLENGDISVKTYAKRFDDETGDIVPNLARPRDIPDMRWIDLRLNDAEKELPTMPLDKTPEA